MAKPSAQDLYKARTGKTWVEAVAESGRLQQQAMDAHTQYLDAFGEVSSEQEHLLKMEMKKRFEESIAYWDRMWQDLKDT